MFRRSTIGQHRLGGARKYSVHQLPYDELGPLRFTGIQQSQTLTCLPLDPSHSVG